MDPSQPEITVRSVLDIEATLHNETAPGHVNLGFVSDEGGPAMERAAAPGLAKASSEPTLQALSPDTKQHLQGILKANAGILKNGTGGILMDELLPGDDGRARRFSTVAMEMLREREDRDLHPYGRGGRFEGFLYDARRVKVTLDHSKMLAWISMILLLILLTGAIIYLAESDRIRNVTTTVKPDENAASTTATG